MNKLKILIKWIEYKAYWKFIKDIIENASNLIKQFYENHFTTTEIDF